LEHVALIPARAGSKSIINKNLIRLNGNETITEKAVKLAKVSKIFRKIILTSDIEYFLESDNLIWEGVTKHERPDKLCTDTALMKDVVSDALNSCKIAGDSWVWLLQPTTPFRKLKDFQQIKRKLDLSPCRSVISLRDVEETHPSRMYTIHGEKAFPLKRGNFHNKQDLNPVYIRNGAFYVFKAGDFLSKESFFIEPCYGHIMPHQRSINIDGPMDLFLAKQIIEKRLVI
jgi:CMP-N,N'-diacetyllegionaminic acid synthase